MRIDGQARAGRPDISALLKAPAGSGKTRALVGRLVTLLCAGARPSDTAAITFTEKAAHEMKERLFKILSDPNTCQSTAKEALELSPEDLAGQPAAGSAITLEEIFGSLVREPDSLRISTIHSFLLELLRTYPLEAGLPAGFEVLPETGLLLRREAAVEEVVKLLEKGELANEYDVLYRAGYDLLKLRGLISLSLEKRGLITRARSSSGGLGLEIEKAGSMLREMIGSNALQTQALQTLEIIPELLDEPTVRSLHALSNLRDPEELPGIFDGIKGLFYTKKGSPFANIPPAKKEFVEVYGGKDGGLRRARWEEVYPGFRESFSGLAFLYDSLVSAKARDAFLSLSRLSEEVYRKMCLRDGLIDFEDIEIYALKLLDSRPDIRLPRHLLVDEFQDTSQIQWDLLVKIAGEQFSGEGVEGLGSPTFFAVGDVNQSIYRFRKAETRLIKDLQTLMEERIIPRKRDFPELDVNFRSAPEIIKFTDQVFAPLLGSDYRGSREMRHFSGSVRLRLAEDEPGALGDEVIRALDLDVEDHGEVRKAHFGDMAVLIQSRARLKDYERALRRSDIPFQVLGGAGFFQQDEVLSILAVLKYLENPFDTFSLRQALRTLFGIPEWLIPPLKGGEILAGLSGISPAACQASVFFERWREAANTLPLPDLVDDVIKSSSAYKRFGSARSLSTGQAVFNLEKLSRLAREFGRSTGCEQGVGRGGLSTGGGWSAGSTGLHDFIEWVRDYRSRSTGRKGGDLPSASVRAGDSRYLTIMTIHSAKGLEFPVVFLPGMGAHTRNDTGDVLFGQAGEDVPFAIRTESLLEENRDYQALKDREAGKPASDGGLSSETARERIRLFYVAVTRARDHLVMLSGMEKPRGETFMRMLADPEIRQAPPPVCLFPEPVDRRQGFSADVSEYVYPAPPSNERARSDKPCHRPPVAEGMRMPPPENLAPLPDPPGTRFISPSSLADHELLKSAPAWGEGSAAIGRLVHEALESYGRTGGYNMKTLPSFGQSSKSEAEEAERILVKLLSLPHIKELLSPCDSKYFELPLLIRNGDAVVYGFADLVIVADGAARVIDFKTGISNIPEEICALAYRPQLDAYADAVRAIFGVRGVEKHLLIAETGKLLPV
ncbi:MAG: UvrD-helicase domain-containing protein [Nitrospirota bacterium]